MKWGNKQKQSPVNVLRRKLIKKIVQNLQENTAVLWSLFQETPARVCFFFFFFFEKLPKILWTVFLMEQL